MGCVFCDLVRCGKCFWCLQMIWDLLVLCVLCLIFVLASFGFRYFSVFRCFLLVPCGGFCWLWVASFGLGLLVWVLVVLISILLVVPCVGSCGFYCVCGFGFCVFGALWVFFCDVGFLGFGYRRFVISEPLFEFWFFVLLRFVYCVWLFGFAFSCFCFSF